MFGLLVFQSAERLTGYGRLFPSLVILKARLRSSMLKLKDLHPLAQCPKGKICSYIPTTDDDQVQVERCEYCHRRVHFNKDKNGRIDNERYQAINIRSFIQPQGAMKGLFMELYGNSPIEKNRNYHLDKAKAKRKKEELQEEARDYSRYLYRTGNEK